VGLGAGATGAILAGRWTRKQARKASPTTIAREARSGLFDLSRLVAESIEEGKRAMDERERELRARLDVPPQASDDADRRGGPGAPDAA